MTSDSDTFGGRLYAELRRLTGYNLITGMLDYQAIQQLKVADREDATKLFHGSGVEAIQLLKTAEPEEVAQYFVAKAEEVNVHGASLGEIILALSSLVSE
jgi:hypothetical protein